jgi:sialate O-acetylesterase
MFSDGMVLQRETQANLWGTARKSATVTITTSWDKKKYLSKTDANGQWRQSIMTPRAGGPYSITLSDGETTVLNDILIGEVWICSGQSNMEMQMKGFKAQPVEGAITDGLHSRDPHLRMFAVKRNSQYAPVDTVSGSWMDATPAHVREFSATAYYFGRALRDVLNIPVGLIVTSWGGSACEAWMTAEWLSAFPDAKIPQSAADIKSQNRTPTVLYNGMLHPLIGYTMRGVIWYQGCTNAGQFTYYPLHKLFIEELRDRWNDDAMPFLLVQLAAFHQHTPDHPVKPEDIDALPFPEFSAYGLTREIQAELAKDMENVGMITAFDCGDPSDIHPRDKQTVGLRLALKAEDMLHWISRSCDGPVFRRMSIEGPNVILYFDNVGKGLKTTDGKPP